jgi:tRNA(fMet)-specific endonuclease VapC
MGRVSLFMLDTNMVSFALRGSDNIDAKLQALQPGQWCISAVTYSEILYGLHRRPEAVRLRRLVKAFLEVTAVMPWDKPAAEAHARIRAALAAAGTPIGNADEMIAGHALSPGAALITDKIKHFQRVEGLSIENWRQ